MTTRYLYLHDLKNPGRVVTIARRLSEDKTELAYAYAMSKPTTFCVVGDTFRKTLGRKIAEGRLDSGSSVIRIKLGEKRPIEAILEDLSTRNDMPNSLQRIAKSYLV